MMMKDFLRYMDCFLPSQFQELAEAQLLYRGRVIVATSLVSLVTVFVALVFSTLFQLPNEIIFGAILCITTLIGQLLYLKFKVSNVNENLVIGASVQLIILTLGVYMMAFSANGMGFFGLIWLIPLFLMVAFYYNTRFSFYFGVINLFLYLVICRLQFHQFMVPVKLFPNFATIYFIFLTLVIIFSSALAFLFVYLNEELQVEVVKQRDILIESAKFQSLGQMASNLAHDINNPLFTVQGKLHQMRNLLSRDQLDLEKCDKIVESVEATLFKLSQIVKGISTFAREGRGDQMVSINLAELIESNLALAIDRISISGITLKVNSDPSIFIICYPSFISQVLLNLLNNAIDALDLMSSSSPKEIEVSAYQLKNWVYLSIADTGSGVPKELETKIFDPFFTTKTFGKGTGLGLSISKGLVDVHEGELSYARVGQKTVFEVKLPSYE
jgi:signal transduction histidine kinase